MEKFLKIRNFNKIKVQIQVLFWARFLKHIPLTTVSILLKRDVYQQCKYLAKPCELIFEVSFIEAQVLKIKLVYLNTELNYGSNLRNLN